ncbi:MAG: hypothetical protein JRG76_01340 [Deltaproteobacteria bacterium]|nr:hypothetical protein [Deltaproteobacteria bacterium]
MPEPGGDESRPGYAMAVCAAIATITVGAHVATALISAHGAGVGLSELGAYFDGHLYLEIARSFPLPFSPDGLDYTGQAPGYPAFAWLLRALLPDAWIDWGGVLLLASWLPAGAATAIFYAVCRELGAPALWPTALFAVGNPRLFTMAASSHPEPLALCLALLALLAFLRGRLGWCLAWITLAGFTRFAAFLVLAPLLAATVLRERRLDLRTLALFAIPPALFALYLAYLHARVPAFVSVAESHRVFWQTHFTWPFRALVRSFDSTLWSSTHPSFQLTYASLGFYLAMLGAGVTMALRSRRPETWLLTLWIAIVLGVHVSLAGVLGAWDFMRLTALAWPAALLLLAVAVGRDLPRGAAAALTVLLLCGSGLYARAQMTEAAAWQRDSQAWFLPETLATLDSNEPRWIDFRARAAATSRGEP